MLRLFCGSNIIIISRSNVRRKSIRTGVAATTRNIVLLDNDHTEQATTFPLPCHGISVEKTSFIISRFQSSLAQSIPLDVHDNAPPTPVLGGIELAITSPETPHPYHYTLTVNQNAEIQRLSRIRVVGVFAHVDAGKTTLTERALALAGVVRRAGNVDDGDTVTDFLPAERERGITIQCAAISFPWTPTNASRTRTRTQTRGDSDHEQVNHHNQQHQHPITISLIDTPGHVDFSVEVNRSVAVLDGAVLVVDAVAGVQAQTETVWRAMNKPSINNHDSIVASNNHNQEQDPSQSSSSSRILLPYQDHAHEPLPCIAVINKMDKDGCNFAAALDSMRRKLPGSNPIPLQLPLFQTSSSASESQVLPTGVVAASSTTTSTSLEDVAMGTFCGVVDLVQMQAILWPDLAMTQGFVSNVKDCAPIAVQLLDPVSQKPYDLTCPVTQAAYQARHNLLEALANVDAIMEAFYLEECEPSVQEMKSGIRRAVLAHQILPVFAAAAVRGKGVEPILDGLADYLPSPLDRQAPALTVVPGKHQPHVKNAFSSSSVKKSIIKSSHHPQTYEESSRDHIEYGHALHSDLLALAFKVVHMKGKGSGDGRTVFCRVYSGSIREGQVLKVTSPATLGEIGTGSSRVERVGGMLELAGGRFGNLSDGVCQSGEVCALIGLKSVVTGDTITCASVAATTSSDNNNNKKKSSAKRSAAANHKANKVVACLAGVSAPKPVLTVRLEAESKQDQSLMSEALRLLSIEDPSLCVEENESATLLSGLGELHIEVTLDRLYRDYGLRHIRVGPPSVTYHETVLETITSDGWITFDRTMGGTRLQGSVQLSIEPTRHSTEDNGLILLDSNASSSSCLLMEPVVTIESEARAFLKLDANECEPNLMIRSPLAKALIQGIQGALKRGRGAGSHPMSNLTCCVINVDAEGGLSGLEAMPGALRAAAAYAVTEILSSNRSSCHVLEPLMSIEVYLPNNMVGLVLSDLTSRRGSIGEVVMGEGGPEQKSIVRGEVPLVEILGYANGLRSLTGGEGSFTAEYKCHAPCTSR